MTFHDRGTIIEGIGDDMIMAMLMFTTIVTPLVGLFIWWVQSQRSTLIHPQSADAVEDTRNRLQRSPPTTQTEDNVQPQPPTARSDRTDRTCPICLAEAVFGIETNCGHLYCGDCILTYWRHGNWLGTIRCPVCRQQVTLMLQNFNPNEIPVNSEDKRNIIQHVNRYNRRFSGEPIPWIDYLRDLPTLLRHAIRELFTLSGLVWMFRLRIVVCFICALLYFISPLDLIPEAVFGILGLLDDAFVLLIMGVYVTIIYRRAVTEMANRS